MTEIDVRSLVVVALVIACLIMVQRGERKRNERREEIRATMLRLADVLSERE
jgi:hypothetical protein